MSRNQNRAKLLPGSENGQPIIMWDGELVHFPVHDELVLHATESGTPPPPQAKIIDASGRVLCTYEASLEDVITEEGEAEVRARARATVERLQALLEAGRTALATRPGGPAVNDIDYHQDEDEDDEDDEDYAEVGERGARSPMRAFLRHASHGVAAYLIWAFLLPLIETMVAGVPGEGGILFITGLTGLALSLIAFLNGILAVLDLLDIL